MSSAWASRTSTSSDAGVERSTGTSAAMACSFAVTLFPAISSTRDGGPMKTMPFAAAFSASSGFSDKNP